VATDPDIPTNTLTFSLDPGAPASASIGSSSGIFTWTTDDADAGTTNNVTVRVTDNGMPPLSDAKSFVVNVVSRPVITSIEVTNEVARLTWTALAGQKYQLQFKTNAVDNGWSNTASEVTATNSSVTEVDSSGSQTERLYRVQVVVP
jgi:hypothetical protein